MDSLKSIFNQYNGTMEKLPPGHEFRFRKKLKEKLPQNSSRIVNQYLGYAVAASVLLLLYFIFSNRNNTIEQRIILGSETKETVEAEVYLLSTIENKIEFIELLDSQNKHLPKLKKEFTDLNNTLNSLKYDLKEAPGDHRIVEAVLNTYLMKIESLEKIEFILQKIS